MSTVVNIKNNHDYDVYIGRGKDSKWANPFSINNKDNRDVVCDRFEEYFWEGSLPNDISELSDKVLGCFCKPNRCHGDFLVDCVEFWDEKGYLNRPEFEQWRVSKIDKFMTFRDNLAFLSNMYPCDVTYDGITYSCVESAFQAQKTDDIEVKKQFAKMPGNRAKQEGRQLSLRSDWEDVKLGIMGDLVKQKFTENEWLGNKLKWLDGVDIVENNNWYDTYWGKCRGVGENHLGSILMDVRDDLINHDPNIIKNISIVSGDLFKSNAKCIVNAVNCVGVMGAGLAVPFKKRYPDMFDEYKQLCNDRKLKPGVCHLYHAADGRDILNFPTKFHWKNDSKLEYIEKGLDWMVAHQDQFDTVAMPALGCGLGKLDFEDVKKLVVEKLKDTNIRLELYEPSRYSSKSKNFVNNQTNKVENESLYLTNVSRSSLKSINNGTHVCVTIPDRMSELKYGLFPVSSDSVIGKDNPSLVDIRVNSTDNYTYVTGKGNKTVKTGLEISRIFDANTEAYRQSEMVEESQSEDKVLE